MYYYLNVFNGFGFIEIIVTETQTVPSLASENFFRLASEYFCFVWTQSFLVAPLLADITSYSRLIICFLFPNLESDIISLGSTGFF